MILSAARRAAVQCGGLKQQACTWPGVECLLEALHAMPGQLLAPAAATGLPHNTSSSTGPQQQPAWPPAATAAAVRGMAGRTHKLSLKKANNRASWMAVQPFLEQQQPADGPGPQQQQQQQPAAQQVIDSALPPLPEQPQPPLYRRIGRITGPYAVDLQPCFAVIESGGTQFKVTPDDVIYHNKIPGVTVNDVLEFGRVLLLGGRDATTIGRPFVPGASVVAAVEETFKDAKVWVFKKKKRKRYSKLHGHRSHITALRILDVRVPSEEQVAAATAALLQDAADAAAAAAASAQQPPAAIGGSSSDQPDARPPAATAARRKRLPLHLLPGRQHGPPAVTNVRSMAQPPPRPASS